MKSAVAVAFVAVLAAVSADATTVTLATLDNYPDGCGTADTANHVIVGRPDRCVPFMGRVVNVDCNASQVNLWRGGSPPFLAGHIPDDWVPPPPTDMCGVVAPNKTFAFQCTKYLLRSVGFTCTTYNASEILEWKTNEGRCGDAGGPKLRSAVYIKLNTCQVPPNFDTDVASGRRRRRLDAGEVKQLAQKYGEGVALPKGVERGQPVLGWNVADQASYLFAVTTTDKTRFVLNGFFWNASSTCAGTPARTFSVVLDAKAKNGTCHDHDEGGAEDGDKKPSGRRLDSSSTNSNSFTVLGDVSASAVVVSSTPTSAGTVVGVAASVLVSMVAAAAWAALAL